MLLDVEIKRVMNGFVKFYILMDVLTLSDTRNIHFYSGNIGPWKFLIHKSRRLFP